MVPLEPPMSDLDRIRALVLRDEVLQRRLVEIDDRDAFGDAVVALAAGAGIAIGRAAIDAESEADPLGLDRFAGTPVTARAWPGSAWLPTGIVPAGAELAVDWAHFAGQRLTAPFFEADLRRARRRPFNRLMRHRTALSSFADEVPGDLRPPDGLVFHLSRCGSTLVAQMIAAMPGAQVVSESPAIDQVVQLVHTRPDVSLALRVALLRAIVGAYGRGDAGAASPFVVKLDSWHTLALPLFRAAFPDTPWIFLFRDPVEILVSQMRVRGLQTVPLTMPHDLYGIADGDRMPPEEYCARVLARVCDGVLEDDAAGGLFIDHAALPGAVTARILPHFGIVPDAAASTAIYRAGLRDAKTPSRVFIADTITKRHAASAAIHAMVSAHLADRHRSLVARAGGAA